MQYSAEVNEIQRSCGNVQHVNKNTQMYYTINNVKISLFSYLPGLPVVEPNQVKRRAPRALSSAIRIGT